LTFHHAEQTVAAGQSATLTYKIFAGPKDRALLLETGLGLESVLFHDLWNWLAGVCLTLQAILATFQGALGNWGLAILAFALLFRLVTLPLSLFGAKSALLMQAKMADLKPLVAEIKIANKGNSDKLNEAILALYKKHGINPFSHFKGCLPLMIQLPVLIALFQLLLNSYDLRGASFLWIDDLTLTDRLFALPFNIPWLGSYVNLLPLIMFAAMIVVGRAMHVPGREEQGSAGFRYGMPIAMTLLFYPFPAGCMLFWCTGNVLQIAEQRYTTARVSKLLGKT
jgi:YidC/Oxa1 family membrane protein insertase